MNEITRRRKYLPRSILVVLSILGLCVVLFIKVEFDQLTAIFEDGRGKLMLYGLPCLFYIVTLVYNVFMIVPLLSTTVLQVLRLSCGIFTSVLVVIYFCWYMMFMDSRGVFSSGLKEALTEYKHNKGVRDLLDRIQREYNCCGVKSYIDWWWPISWPLANAFPDDLANLGGWTSWTAALTPDSCYRNGHLNREGCAQVVHKKLYLDDGFLFTVAMAVYLVLQMCEICFLRDTSRTLADHKLKVETSFDALIGGDENHKLGKNKNNNSSTSAADQLLMRKKGQKKQKHSEGDNSRVNSKNRTGGDNGRKENVKTKFEDSQLRDGSNSKSNSTDRRSGQSKNRAGHNNFSSSTNSSLSPDVPTQFHIRECPKPKANNSAPIIKGKTKQYQRPNFFKIVPASTLKSPTGKKCKSSVSQKLQDKTCTKLNRERDEYIQTLRNFLDYTENRQMWNSSSDSTHYTLKKASPSGMQKLAVKCNPPTFPDRSKRHKESRMTSILKMEPCKKCAQLKRKRLENRSTATDKLLLKYKNFYLVTSQRNAKDRHKADQSLPVDNNVTKKNDAASTTTSSELDRHTPVCKVSTRETGHKCHVCGKTQHYIPVRVKRVGKKPRSSQPDCLLESLLTEDNSRLAELRQKQKRSSVQTRLQPRTVPSNNQTKQSQKIVFKPKVNVPITNSPRSKVPSFPAPALLIQPPGININQQRTGRLMRVKKNMTQSSANSKNKCSYERGNRQNVCNKDVELQRQPIRTKHQQKYTRKSKPRPRDRRHSHCSSASSSSSCSTDIHEAMWREIDSIGKQIKEQRQKNKRQDFDYHLNQGFPASQPATAQLPNNQPVNVHIENIKPRQSTAFKHKPRFVKTRVGLREDGRRKDRQVKTDKSTTTDMHRQRRGTGVESYRYQRAGHTPIDMLKPNQPDSKCKRWNVSLFPPMYDYDGNELHLPDDNARLPNTAEPSKWTNQLATNDDRDRNVSRLLTAKDSITKEQEKPATKDLQRKSVIAPTAIAPPPVSAPAIPAATRAHMPESTKVTIAPTQTKAQVPDTNNKPVSAINKDISVDDLETITVASVTSVKESVEAPAAPVKVTFPTTPAETPPESTINTKGEHSRETNNARSKSKQDVKERDDDSDKTFDPVVLEGSSGDVIKVTNAAEDSEFFKALGIQNPKKKGQKSKKAMGKLKGVRARPPLKINFRATKAPKPHPKVLMVSPPKYTRKHTRRLPPNHARIVTGPNGRRLIIFPKKIGGRNRIQSVRTDTSQSEYSGSSVYTSSYGESYRTRGQSHDSRSHGPDKRIAKDKSNILRHLRRQKIKNHRMRERLQYGSRWITAGHNG